METAVFEKVKAETFDEIGIKGIRPLRNIVFVRTDPPEQATQGGIFLPSAASRFYDTPAHMRIVKATVLAVGPQCKAQVGDRICFQRLYFGRFYRPLDGGSFFGFIEDGQILGLCPAE